MRLVAWLAEHPAMVQTALLVLPFVVALAAALFIYSPVLACPAASGGSSGGCR
jgi:hypothetical protein